MHTAEIGEGARLVERPGKGPRRLGIRDREPVIERDIVLIGASPGPRYGRVLGNHQRRRCEAIVLHGHAQRCSAVPASVPTSVPASAPSAASSAARSERVVPATSGKIDNGDEKKCPPGQTRF